MKPPRIPSVFKLTEHNRYKRFEYNPRTFDEQKENIEKRRIQIEKEVAREKRLSEDGELHLRERMNETWSRRETRRQNKRSNIRLLVILAVLVLIIYAIYSKFP